MVKMVGGSEIAQIRERLAELDAERASLEGRLAALASEAAAPPWLGTPDAKRVTNTSPAPEKIALFRKLFVGREDVFPLRWENGRTGRAGYAPACANEWVKGI